MNSEKYDDNDATRIAPSRINALKETIITKKIIGQEADATIKIPLNSFNEQNVHEATTIVTKNIEKGHIRYSSASLEVGSILKERYILRELLGSGGMGRVYRATDLLRQKLNDPSPDVAIKVLNDEYKGDPELFIALQRETKKTQQLAHPNIINVHNFDIDNDNIFMVMEILEGQSLKDYLKKTAVNGLSFKKAWPIIKGLALALAYAHKHDIVHSDFKPGNIFIKENADVKVLDFGIACAAAKSENRSNDNFNARNLGALTPAYASLEMFSNQEPEPRDDIYALACVTYELLTGKHPFGGLSSLDASERKLKPPAIGGLPRRQWNALNHALAFKREQRTSTVSQFINEMEPRSALPFVFAGLTAMTLLFSFGYSYYVDLGKYQDAKKFEDNLSVEQKDIISNRLDLAIMQEEVGNLTAPPGGSAVWAYQEVLKIDPYNKTAKEGLEKIVDIVELEAEKLYEQNSYNESLAKIEEGLAAIPKHEGLLKLKKRLFNKKHPQIIDPTRNQSELND